MLEKGIPAEESGFEMLYSSDFASLERAMDSFLATARANNLTILDASFVSRSDEACVVFFYRS